MSCTLMVLMRYCKRGIRAEQDDVVDRAGFTFIRGPGFVAGPATYLSVRRID